MRSKWLFIFLLMIDSKKIKKTQLITIKINKTIICIAFQLRKAIIGVSCLCILSSTLLVNPFARGSTQGLMYPSLSNPLPPGGFKGDSRAEWTYERLYFHFRCLSKLHNLLRQVRLKKPQNCYIENDLNSKWKCTKKIGIIDCYLFCIVVITMCPTSFWIDKINFFELLHHLKIFKTKWHNSCYCYDTLPCRPASI